VEPGDLVVAVVPESGRAGVDRRGRIATLGQDADRLVGRVAVILPHVEHVRRVEGIPLGVQRVTPVLHGHELVLGPELDVVETGVGDVSAEEERQRAVVVRRVPLRELEEAAEAAEGALRPP